MANEEIEKIENWMYFNKLTLNYLKCCFIILSRKLLYTSESEPPRGGAGEYKDFRGPWTSGRPVALAGPAEGPWARGGAYRNDTEKTPNFDRKNRWNFGEDLFFEIT